MDYLSSINRLEVAENPALEYQVEPSFLGER